LYYIFTYYLFFFILCISISYTFYLLIILYFNIDLHFKIDRFFPLMWTPYGASKVPFY
ncbi:unnamed protein product, partial [Brassica rapa subsp. trilocularis]